MEEQILKALKKIFQSKRLFIGDNGTLYTDKAEEDFQEILEFIPIKPVK